MTNTIGAVSGTVEESGFGDNTWGYNLSEGTPSDIDNLTYQAVPGDSTVQKGFGSEGPTASDTYTLTFGTKVNTSLPSGTYSNQVVVSVVANPAYVPNLTQISNMQDMTTEICNASTVGQTNRLTDTRDGKLYWVAKLADNQCWMTQNLDLDLDSSKPLTSADSDISDSRGSWTPTDTQDNTTGFDTSDLYGTQYFDPGMYVNNDPTAWTSCNNYWNGGSCDNWTNVSNMSPMTEIRDESTSVVDTNSNAYDAHYLAGNYYQWNAATAGTGGSLNSYDDATGSICPKGWTLPSDRNSDYSQLTSAYSISGNPTGATALTKSPLYFIPAGHVFSGLLNDAGSHGSYWSSTAYSSTTAYSLGFYSGNVSPSNTGANRYFGFSVRCLAR